MRRELHLAVRTAKAPWLLAASILVLGLACAACSSGRAAPGDATASAAVPSAAATTTASPTYSTMHPPLTPCQNTGNIVGPTSRALYDVHGHSSACLGNLAGAIILQVEGAPSADARPGYIVCSPPPTDPDDYCGAGMHGPVSEVSDVDHWQFYPFPAPDVTEAAGWVIPQDYICVGDASQLWTFHMDTFTYTDGCIIPPTFDGIALRPCDAFLYAGPTTAPPLYLTYGKAFACGLYGSTVAGIVHGKSPAGVLVCAPPEEDDGQAVATYCGFAFSDPPVPVSGHWQFVPLPVDTAEVDSATFDTAAGTACLTAGGQPFTFTLATRAFAPGCGAAPSVTPAVEATTTP